MSSELQYHIMLSKEHGAKYAILPGDPGRVPKIAEYLDNAVQVGFNREYNSYLGTLNGERVLVVSTGIGAPSAAICVEELAKIGVDTFLRVGTCGGMQEFVEPGDVVIATGAVRMDGTSKEYMPIEFPAVADFDVTAALKFAAVSMGYRHHLGVVQAKDSFYGQHSPESMPNSQELLSKWKAWKMGGCLASEMESSALFIVSSVRKLRAGAVFHCVWNQETAGSAMPESRKHDTSCAIKTAVEALKILIEQDKSR
ncbi:MAG: uridine phosphorylase [Ruminococcaceae bacterium]|nr:uridine phosphorylase [Oscillospiraceae bacterium]